MAPLFELKIVPKCSCGVSLKKETPPAHIVCAKEVRNRRFCLTKHLSDGQSWPPERDSSSYARDTSQLLPIYKVYRESINL